MKQCTINGCNLKHYAKGFCRRHYKSLYKYGNPLKIDENLVKQQVLRSKKEALRIISVESGVPLTSRGTFRKVHSREGVCSVDGCNSVIKSKKLCEKHYARMRRLGKVELQRMSLTTSLDKCLVFDCNKAHFRRGLCNTHYSYQLKFKTPYLVKTIRLCGVENCENQHLARGLCKKHYSKFSNSSPALKPNIINLCGIKECGQPHFTNGLCKNHNNEWTLLLKENGLK